MHMGLVKLVFCYEYWKWNEMVYMLTHCGLYVMRMCWYVIVAFDILTGGVSTGNRKGRSLPLGCKSLNLRRVLVSMPLG